MLNANNLRIAQIATDDGSRFALHAIRVTPDYTEVTDGHQAVRVTTPQGVKTEDFPSIDGLKPVNEFPSFLLDKDHALGLLEMLGNRKRRFLF